MDYRGIPKEIQDELFQKFKTRNNKDRLLVTMYFLSDLDNMKSRISLIENELLKVFPKSINNNFLPKDYKDFQASVVRGQFNNQELRNQNYWINVADGCWRNSDKGNQVAESILKELNLEKYIRKNHKKRSVNIFKNLKQEVFRKDIDFSRIENDEVRLKFELMLRQASSKYETIGDYIYFNYHNHDLLERILEVADIELSKIVQSKRVVKSYTIYFALVIIQLQEYKDSFWGPIRKFFDIYKKHYYSNQIIDSYIRKIIDSTQEYAPEEIERQSLKVQYDSGFSFHFVRTVFSICYDYYKSDLEYGLTESNFVDEALFLLQGLKHRFNEDSIENDDVKISSKVYILIKSIRLRMRYTSEMMNDLFIEVLRMINGCFWKFESYNGNHFLRKSFEEWAKEHITSIDIKTKKLLNRKIEQREHIIRKADLFYHEGKIYYKIPDQKIKDIQENEKVSIHLYLDTNNYEYIPSVSKQMIGYSLSGIKKEINNPFDTFGYKLLNGNQKLYESETNNMVDYYIFDAKSGRRIQKLDGQETIIVILVKENTNLAIFNGNILSESIYYDNKLVIVEINERSFVRVNDSTITALDISSCGILYEVIPYVKTEFNGNDIPIVSKKPKIVIPANYTGSRLMLSVNGENYVLDTNMDKEKPYKVEELDKLEFIEGYYTMSITDVSSKKDLYSASFLYLPNTSVKYNNNLYFTNEVASVTIRKEEEIFSLNIKQHKHTYVLTEKYKLVFELPYLEWYIDELPYNQSRYYVGELPKPFSITSKVIEQLEADNIKIDKTKKGDLNSFDLTDIFNQSEETEKVSIKAHTSRGIIKMFDVYLVEKLLSVSVIYDDENQMFLGQLDNVGTSKLEVVVKSSSNELNCEISSSFEIKFPKDKNITFKIYRLVSDEFGINDERLEVFSKEFHLINPLEMIGKTLIPSVKKKNNKTEEKDSLFNIRIEDFIGDNNFYGEAFIETYYGNRVTFNKLSPIRIEFLDGNFSTQESNVKVYMNNDEEIPSEWQWFIKNEDKGGKS